jgi:hypothetical protein
MRVAWLCAAAILAAAAPAPWSATTWNAAGMAFTSRLPPGWSLDDNGERVTPPGCVARREVTTDREWNRFLAAALHPDDFREKRQVLKIGGHRAVTARSTVDGKQRIRIYVDLSDVRSDTVLTWTLDGSGRDCEMHFLSVAQSTIVRRDAP